MVSTAPTSLKITRSGKQAGMHGKKGKDKDKPAKNPSATKTKTLSISQKLTSVLCTKLMMSNKDTKEICKECQAN
jgi:hypothetical protein